MQTIAKKPHTASITIAASDSAESRGKTIVSFIYERKKQKLGRSLDGDDQESADVQLYDSKRYAEFRAQSVLVPTSGGYVADDFLAALELALIQGDPVRQVATVVRNEIGSKYSVPTVNDTATDAEVLEENDTASEADVMFGQSVFAPHKYNSKGVRVPNDLLEDAPAGFATDLARVLSRRISRKQGADFSVGDGAAKPFGIVTQAVLGVTAASAVAITGDELYDLIFSIDAEFLPRSAFMMHPTIYRYLSKLVDGAGAYKLRKFGPFNLAGFNVVLKDRKSVV